MEGEKEKDVGCNQEGGGCPLMSLYTPYPSYIQLPTFLPAQEKIIKELLPVYLNSYPSKKLKLLTNLYDLGHLI